MVIEEEGSSKEKNRYNRRAQKEKEIYKENKKKQFANNNRLKEDISKNKQENTEKEKAKEKYHTQLGSGKIEDGIILAKGIDAIIISLMSTSVVSTNNSATGE
ncbi:25411_t:CDS:2, partial [Gigaspora margarita]